MGSAVAVLPASLRKRVRLLDEHGKIQAKCNALFAEIAAELQLELGGGAVGMPEITSEAHTAAAQLYLEMYPYLVALEHEMEVASGVEHWADQADKVRAALRNPEARGVLAAISGLARTYHRIQSHIAVVQSDAHPRLVNRFEELMDDHAYKHLSQQTRLLGVPGKVDFAKSRMKTALRALLERPLARELLTEGSRVVAAVTSVPLPDAETVSRVFGKQYLPPIVSFKETIQRAKAAWKQAKPEFVPLPGLRDDITAEWEDLL
jgi:hypothetical protein